MEDVKIKVFAAPYLKEVIKLILDIQQGEFGVPITLEQQPDLNNIATFYQRGNGNFWVALHNEHVVGTIALIDIGNSQVALRKMLVHEKFRGKQHRTAQLLLDEALDWMKQKKCNQVFPGTLDVFKAAQKFYRKNGFEEVAKSDLPQNFPTMALDNTFFRKTTESINGVEILTYQSDHQHWFEKLNRDWIEK